MKCPVTLPVLVESGEAGCEPTGTPEWIIIRDSTAARLRYQEPTRSADDVRTRDHVPAACLAAPLVRRLGESWNHSSVKCAECS